MTALAGILIGLVAGIASGVAGIGGGVVMIPGMTELMGVAQFTAQGTSLVAILFTSMAGTIVHVRNRRVDLKMGLLVGVSGVVAAQLGAATALSLDQEVLRRVFGALVLASGVRMLWRLWRERRSARVDAGPD